MAKLCLKKPVDFKKIELGYIYHKDSNCILNDKCYRSGDYFKR